LASRVAKKQESQLFGIMVIPSFCGCGGFEMLARFLKPVEGEVAEANGELGKRRGSLLQRRA